MMNNPYERPRAHCKACWYPRQAREARRYRAKNPDKVRLYTARENLRKCGVPEREIPALVERWLQHTHCELCGREAPPYVDHSHRTGQFRGLLCNTCNTGLGMLKEDPVLLKKAIRYLLERGT